MKCHFSLLAAFVAAVLSAVHAAPISHEEIEAKSAQGLRLLSLAEGVDPVWKTEEEKLELMRANKHFFDVTETYETRLKLKAAQKNSGERILATFPAPSHQTLVNSFLPSLSTSSMQSYDSSLSSFNNRYYNSATGQQSSAWILSTVQSIISGKSGLSAASFKHSWLQPSVIVKWAGTTSGPVTIIGAHQDSINLNSPSSGRAPGADDDGTGSVNVLEILRVLVAGGYKPTYPIEFHWYAGEEVGLLGSEAVATSYANAGVKVKAMMQLDMSGYFKPGSKEVIALEADYIDSGLNTFVKSLVTTYTRLPWAMDTPCGYACSDHASWYEQGYPTAMPYEAITGNDDPNIHGSGDTTSVSGFSWSHSLEFAKVGLAFVVELTA